MPATRARAHATRQAGHIRTWSADRWWRFASWLGLLALLVLAPRLALDSGTTWDEAVQLEYGDRILAWFRSGFTDRSAFDFKNLYLYGGLFDLPAQWLLSKATLPWGPYEVRHVLTAWVAVLGIVATWKTAARVAGPRAGAFAALVLALTPSWVGHGLFNPKDIPFGAAAAFVAYASTCIAMRPAPLGWGDALRAGVCVGIALGVRSGGMFLLAYPVIAAAGRLVLDASTQRPRLARAGVLSAVRLACALPIAWALMLSAWPWAQVAPFSRPLEAAAIAARFDWKLSVLFGGQQIKATELPLSYLPTWFAITLPETYALAAACGLAAFIAAFRRRDFDRERTLAISLLILFIAAPLAGVLIKRPVLYDAHRHFLFLLPLMAALAGLALDAFAARACFGRWRAIAGAAFAALAGLIVFDLASLHPYEYVYFNRSSGGLPAAAARYETDYWGASYREGFDWVVKHVEPRTKPIPVAACSMNHVLRYYRRQWPAAAEHFVIAPRRNRAEIFLAFTRNDCHKTAGEILYTVQRQGVPLLYVLRR